MTENKRLKNNSISRIHKEFAEQEAIREKRKHNLKVSLYRRLTVMCTIFLLIIGSLIFTLVKQHSILNQKNEEKVVLQKDLKEQTAQQKELKTQIVKLDDDDYIANIVRKDLLLSKKGEKIFNIPNTSTKDDEEPFSKSEKE